MHDPIKTGVISIKELPKDKILVGLKKPFKIELLQHIEPYKLGKILGIKPSQFYNLKVNEKIKLSFLLNLSDYLVKNGFNQFSYEDIEKNIEIIGTKRGDVYIRNPNLPFNFNNEAGVYFISAILFDGGIDRQYKPHYGNINHEMRKRIVNCANQLFGEITSEETKHEKRLFIRFPKAMGIILNHCFKIGIGNKMYCNNKIPDFIFSLNNVHKIFFLRQAFDDDGTVLDKTISLIGVTDVDKESFDKNSQIEFPLLNGIKELLNDLDIQSNPLRFHKTLSDHEYRKKGEFRRYVFRLTITGRENLKKYYDAIGFNLAYKLEKLKKNLESYKSVQLRKGEIKEITLQKCKVIKKDIKIPLLAKEINRTYRQTVRIVRELEKEGLLELTKPTVNIGGRKFPAVYSLKSIA